jgi:hypothetical protein
MRIEETIDSNSRLDQDKTVARNINVHSYVTLCSTCKVTAWHELRAKRSGVVGALPYLGEVVAADLGLGLGALSARALALVACAGERDNS